MKAEYKKRVVDEILDFYLESMGAVLIEGPKWCGKTRTGQISRRDQGKTFYSS